MKRAKILITAGPTRERIDNVRYISNFSTGNMGYELAKASVKRSYHVTLISGPTNLTPPKGAEFIQVEDAKGMEQAVNKHFKNTDCLFMASAVCDWRPRKRAEKKIKKSKSMLLNLVENTDILKNAGKAKNGTLLVGFALETDSLIKNAKQKLKNKNLDMIVANRITKSSTPFGPGRTDITIIDRQGHLERIKNTAKSKVAERLLDRAEGLWQKRG